MTSTSNPLEWNNEDVVSWLETIPGINISPTTGITDCFMKHDVVGRDLFILKREDLFDLGISRVPDARRIMNAIDDLKGRADVAFGGTDGDGCSADALSDIFGDCIIGLPDINEMPTTEADYWRLVECTFILRLLLLRSTSDIAHDLYFNAPNGRRHSALPPDNGLHVHVHPETPDTKRELKQRRRAIEELLQKIEQSISLNVESVDASPSLSPPSWTPVLTKIAKTYKMSDSELDVLRFITTVKITKSALLRSLLPSDDHAETPLVEDSCRCTLVQYVCCLSQLQMSSITDESRPLVIDRVLGEISDDVLATEFKFVVPDEVCRLLLGEPLSTEDTLKLAGTRLQNIDVVAVGSEQQVPAKGSAPSSVVSGAAEGANASATKTIKKMLGDLTMENEGEGLGIDDLDIESLGSGVAALIDGEGGDEDMLDEDTDSREPRPYTCELDYLSDQFSMIMQQIQVANQRLQRDLKRASLEAPDRWMRKEGRKSASLGELSAKLSLSKRKIEASLELTRKEGKFYPRLEELVRQLQLDAFEKSVLIYLVGSMISPLFKSSIASDSLRGLVGSGRKCSVGDLLQVFCESVADQVAARTHFYRTSKMVEKGLIRLAEGYGVSDLTDQEVQLDRRVLDCIVGLDKESTEVIQGSYLYDPAVDINSVVLAPGLKEAILSSTVNFDTFLRYRKQSSFDKAISYGVGLTLMFSGASGTGKTMMANALAAKVGKKLLLVDFPRLSQQANSNGSSYQSIFREAELSDAILFFDECETLFMKRDSGGSTHLTELLTQMERFEGICLLATNRPFDLDEAMFRRISEVFEFKPPNHVERQEIWRVVTTHEAIPCDDDINWDAISLKYELTGGFIKNAVISALQLAVGRDPTSPSIRESDIIEGCKKQMRGALQMADFEERVVPKSGLEEIIVSDIVKEKLKAIVDIEKARGVLFGRWGFDNTMRSCQGTTALFWGPRGSGKQNAAEAIGFELGKPLKVTDLPQLLGKTGKANATVVRECFKEARLMDAILVLGGISFNPGEGQRGASSTEDTRLLNLVIREMMRFPGIVVLKVDVVDSLDIFVSRLEKGLLDGLKYLVSFQPPNRSCRKQLWEKLLPDTLPKKSIDYSELARRSDELNVTQIGNAVYRAAALAALKPESSRYVTMQDLLSAIEEERQRGISSVDRYVKAQYI